MVMFGGYKFVVIGCFGVLVVLVGVVVVLVGCIFMLVSLEKVVDICEECV